MKNVFYLSNLNIIGGVETMQFELARKYQDYDITVIYKTGTKEQINRLKKYVRVKKYNGEKIVCDKFFIHYDLDILENVEAKEIIRIVHYLSKTQKNAGKPKIHPKITKHIAVSETAGKEWEETTGIKCEVLRNPLQLTEAEKKPALLLVSATRLTPEKGKDRIIELGKQLDRAGVKYLWIIFTNDKNKIDNDNIVYMKPRLDIRPFLASIKGKGYGVQLSDCEGDCYFTRECEALGIPLLVTPIKSFEEQGLKDGENCYYIPFDMENIDINKIVNNIPNYNGYIQEDNWEGILEKGKSKYKEEMKMKYLVRATNKYEKRGDYDIELSKEKGVKKYIPKKGEEWIVDFNRKEMLEEAGYVDVVKEIEEIETAVKEVKKETAVKTTRRKKKNDI